MAGGGEQQMVRRYIDLSHPIEPGMTCFPGDPEPRIEPLTMAPPWRVTRLQLGSHTGTHIDAPAHYVSGGRSISDYPLERFFPVGMVVPLAWHGDDEAIAPEALRPYLAALPPGAALLLRTGWDRYWKTERYLHHPYLSPTAALLLAEAGVALVGIDALNVDSTQQGSAHAHAALLGNDVLIVENLTGLDRLLPGLHYQCAFLPLPLAGLDGSPVRALAWRDELA
jgi:arylformamidase